LAVPAPLHASLAIEAMKAGKHVYVEKPLSMSEAEGEQMIGASEKYGVHLMVGHLLQYHPIFVEIRSMVADKVFGKLQYIYSNRLSLGKIRSEEDVIWSFAPHDISMILSLAGQEPQQIRADATCILQNNIADAAIIHMEFASNLKAHVSVSWLHPVKEQKLVVVGEHAMAIFDDTQPWNKKLAVYNHDVNISGQEVYCSKADVEYRHVEEAEPLQQECQYFIELIQGSVPPLTDGREGLRVLKVLEAASLSATQKRIIKMAR
jgi:UDP-2-acetamido-3-amino-2,3-dideoxy-glucuronate N-acetyltransferase